jgi:hypothetical protein
MDTAVIWKSLFMLHMISNALFLGSSFVFAYGKGDILSESTIKRYLKFLSVFIAISGLSGIGLLSILSMSGMDDLTSNPSGISVLFMILGYLIALFIFSLTVIYKGGEEKIYKRLFSIMFHIYLFVYLIRGFLV